MSSFRLLFVTLLLTLVAGCASMSDSQCRVADWGRVGLSDGARGEPEHRLASYTEDCGKIGVVPNAQAYRQGWDVGIQRYCTPANGWQAGLAGQGYKAQSCSGQAQGLAFSQYLQAGLQLHHTQLQINNNLQEITRLQKKLESPGTDDDKRKTRRRLQDIDRDQYRLRLLMGQQQLLAPGGMPPPSLHF